MSEASERALKRIMDVIDEQGLKLSKDDYYALLEDLDSEVATRISACDEEDDQPEDDEEDDSSRLED